MKENHSIRIRLATNDDSLAISVIYNHYVANSIITFEEDLVDDKDIKQRMVRFDKMPWLVCEYDGEIAGYAYATQWKPRAAYLKTVETSIYLDRKYQGLGLGFRLYQNLIDRLRESGFYALLGGIAQPNTASVRLHEKLGFVKVGELKEVGFKFGKRIDVGYWELRLNE